MIVKEAFEFVSLNEANDLMAKWPQVKSCFVGEDIDQLLPTLLTCVREGVVALVYYSGFLAGLCGGQKVGNALVVRYLPKAGDNHLSRRCVEWLRQWAAEKELARVIVYSTRANGSTFRYFTKVLGLRRIGIIFGAEV